VRVRGARCNGARCRAPCTHLAPCTTHPARGILHRARQVRLDPRALSLVIKASTHARVDSLLNDLSAKSASVRESAIAQLTLIGGRAVARLIALADNRAAAHAPRVAALRALEGIADPRGLPAAARTLDDPEPAVATAAANVLRVFLNRRESTTAVERLTRAALDQRRPEAVRLAAIGALSDLPRPTLKPLVKALSDDPSEAIRHAVRPARPAAAPPQDAGAYLQAAIDLQLPDDPSALSAAVTEAGDTVALPLLSDLVRRVREREAAEPANHRAEWVSVRAAAHAALARRNSRLGLYDVRESLEAAAAPLPIEFLKVLAILGDTACLEPIAAADEKAAKAGVKEGDWWRRQLVEAFRAIVAREKLTRRNPTMKKISRRWPRLPEVAFPRS
jgi:HEAT repeat protein